LTGGFYEFSHGNPYIVRTTVKDFCDQFGVPAPAGHPRLEIPASLKEQAAKILAAKKIDPAAFITIHAGPTLPVREWPRADWIKLVAALREHGFTQIVQLGVGRYAAFGKVVVEPMPGVVSLLDELSLEASLAVISLARLHIGIDSGLLHAAAAVGTPAVGIFGNTLPEYRFSEDYRRSFVVSQVACRGCGHWLPSTPFTTGCPNNIRCMQEINPDKVLQACLPLLGKPPS
jgi:ADP-heptose:LPS heptosyltransferase